MARSCLHRFTASTLLILAWGISLGVSPSHAQETVPSSLSTPVETPEVADASVVGVGGIALVYGHPGGEFAQNVKRALGLSVSAHAHFGPGRLFGLGFDGAYLIYGGGIQSLPRTYTGEPLEESTTAQILLVGVGPRLAAPLGPIEPYVGGSVGFALFVKLASRPLEDGDDRIEGHIEEADFGFPAWAAVGGLRVRLTQGATPVSLDLGVRYQVTGPVRYIAGETFLDRDGTSSLTSVKGRTQIWLFHVGVSLRGS